MYKLQERTSKQLIERLQSPHTIMLSYRGSGKGGGVSSTLDELFVQHKQAISAWLFIENDALTVRAQDRQHQLQPLSRHSSESHYAFCNEYLWPFMHGFMEKVAFRNQHYQMYRQLNELIAGFLSEFDCAQVLVHDYQFALVPSLLKRLNPERRVIAFWHIPWPKDVPQKHIGLMTQIAESLAQADRLGFHTQEYRDNFVDFARERLAEYCTDNTVVAPLGVNPRGWDLGEAADIQPSTELFDGKRFVLSIDRGDYTKGIIGRLSGIETFLEHNPQWLHRIVFVQHCRRTRPGLPHFDGYWRRCLAKVRRINAKFASCRPVLWMQEPVSKACLSALYRDASVMLVTPLRDGLNLTAKEFILCQQDDPGVLVLSRTAGAFDELSSCALGVDARQPEDIALKIRDALEMSASERLARMQTGKASVMANDLAVWSERLGLRDLTDTTTT